jgi:hypothetical protein
VPDEPLRVQLAGEDAAQEILLRHLSDAVLGSADLEADTLQQLRSFLPARNNQKTEGYFSTRDATRRLKRLMGTRPGRPYYRSPLLDGKPVGSAAEIIDTVACINKEQTDVGVILLLVDEDGSARRAADARRAQDHFDRDRGQAVLIGTCVPTAEGWLVSLLGPSRPARVTALKAQLSFNPIQQPQKMNADRKSPRHAKRILHALLADKPTPLKQLPAHTPNAADTDEALSDIDIDPRPDRHPPKGGLSAFLRLLGSRYGPMVYDHS